MTHQSRVSTFQQAFTEQKHHLKVMMSQQVKMLRTKLTQLQKVKRQAQNERAILVQQTKEITKVFEKKQTKTVAIEK